MDYRVMWEELKRSVQLNMKYYSESKEFSTIEVANGFSDAQRTLHYMESLEKKYSEGGNCYDTTRI